MIGLIFVNTRARKKVYEPATPVETQLQQTLEMFKLLNIEDPKIFRDSDKAQITQTLKSIKDELSKINQTKILVMVRWIGWDVCLKVELDDQIINKFGKPIDSEK